ncbi:MAG TPA: lactate utilization protein [Parafilimonas sp.]|nr:lactate utilization protein [Parafilimonas sp.]
MSVSNNTQTSNAPLGDGGKNWANDGSRNAILSAIKNNQPQNSSLPVIENYPQPFTDVAEKYKTVLESIGGAVHEIKNYDEAINIINEQFKGAARIITVNETFASIAELYQSGKDAHLLEDVDVAIINAHFGIAENGSVWITENIIKERVLPFICQHLVVLLDKKNIVPTMHDAYNLIGDKDYGFATFIAGPSKTADIEQSLVLGAHGPKTMTVFLLHAE